MTYGICTSTFDSSLMQKNGSRMEATWKFIECWEQEHKKKEHLEQKHKEWKAPESFNWSLLPSCCNNKQWNKT